MSRVAASMAEQQSMITGRLESVSQGPPITRPSSQNKGREPCFACPHDAVKGHSSAGAETERHIDREAREKASFCPSHC